MAENNKSMDKGRKLLSEKKDDAVTVTTEA